MPSSKRHKKKRKSGRKGSLKVDPNKESSITLQELINVVAFQDFQKNKLDDKESDK